MKSYTDNDTAPVCLHELGQELVNAVFAEAKILRKQRDEQRTNLIRRIADTIVVWRESALATSSAANKSTLAGMIDARLADGRADAYLNVLELLDTLETP